MIHVREGKTFSIQDEGRYRTITLAHEQFEELLSDDQRTFYIECRDWALMICEN